MFISLYVVLRAGRGKFGNLDGVCIAYLTLCSPRTACNLGFWREFLMFISFYVVLGADRSQFGILAGFSNVYPTL